MRDNLPIEPYQGFIIDNFKPEYAIGITNLFKSVYDDRYPFDIYYNPNKIIRANKNKSIYSVVAITQKGEVIGHGGVYKTFPDNKRLYELGQLLVLKDYRDTNVAQGISEFIKDQLISILPVDGIFAEATTNQVSSQGLSNYMGLQDVAIEIGLLPSSIFKDMSQSSERISCVFQFLLKKDFRHTIYFPYRAKGLIEFAIKTMRLKRDLMCLNGKIDCEGRSKIKGIYLKKINATRFNIIHTGMDIESCIDNIISEAHEKGIKIYQFIINVSEKQSIKSFNALFNRGFFVGGLLPLWFKNGDGFLMQNVHHHNSFDNINLFKKQSWHILNLIIKDASNRDNIDNI